MLRRALFIAVMISATSSIAQTTSTLSGRVTDNTTQRPLDGATVELLAGDSVIGTVTDTAGHYRFATAPTGIHALRVRHQGHGSTLVPEVWVRAGKAEVVDVAMHQMAYEIKEVEVQQRRAYRYSVPGMYPLTVEQSLRYPATFFDPARLASTRPGVASMNDQANHLSVRGNSPASNAYLLEGAEIVNPNHLTNAGTASDQPTLSGGGVSILSAQMLGTSYLLTGSFDAAHGNALGGIMDVRLRNGTNERRAFTLQAGLLGIDLSTEGPFKNGGGASYLVNYRYSTVGLLSAMGVNLGDEVITFQDLSFHVSLPMRRGSLSLFGLGGTSSNIFDAKTDTAEWEFDKDSQNIDYNAQMGAVGGTFRSQLGSNAIWSMTAVISENDQEREAEFLDDLLNVMEVRTSELAERKLSIASQVKGSCGKGFNYEIGGSAMERTVEKKGFFPEVVEGWLVRPYAQVGHAFGARLLANVGVAYAYYTFNNSTAAEPRARLQWRIGLDRTLSITAGQRSQLPAVQGYNVGPLADLWDNTRIGLVRSQDLTMAYDEGLGEHTFFHAELFHQLLLDVPIADTSGTLFAPAQGASLVNIWDSPLLMDLAAKGDATNTGIELSIEHPFHGRWFYQVNTTLFGSSFNDALGRSYDSRWNTNYLGNLVLGREFARQKEDMKRTWGLNGRAVVMGGQRFTPTPSSPGDAIEPFSEQLATYYRIDLRVYLKREHKGRTGMWALDLQNATNAQNEAYRYFDTRKNEVVTKYQLGLIPNLSYRIEF